MDDVTKQFFTVDPETGAYVPKPPTAAELEKLNKNKVELIKDKYKHYIFIQNVIRTLKRLEKNIRRIIYRLTHPIEFIEAKWTAYRLSKMIQDPVLLDDLFQENIDPKNLKKMDEYYKLKKLDEEA